jgi:hypothetical protein
VAKKDPEIEILKDGKPLKEPGNDGFTVLLAILAIWAIAFTMGLRLAHPLPRGILFIIAIALTLVLYRTHKKGR